MPTDEKLQRFRSWAEVTASVAVILTLVFLVVELRDNTQVARSTRYSDVISELNEFRLHVNSSESLFPVWQAFIAGRVSELSDSDRLRLNGLLLSLFGIYENAYYSHEYGVLGDAEWQRFEFRICENWLRVTDFGGDDLRRGLTPEFRSYVNRHCRNGAESDR